MSRKRTWSDNELILWMPKCRSIAQVLSNLRLNPTGANYKSIYGHIKRLGLDTSHFQGQGYLKGQKHGWTPKKPLSEIMVIRAA